MLQFIQLVQFVVVDIVTQCFGMGGAARPRKTRRGFGEISAPERGMVGVTVAVENVRP